MTFKQTILLSSLLLSLANSGLAVSQDAPPSSQPTASPVRVCVAKLVTEIAQASDTIALRDRLAAYLRGGSLAKVAKAEILVLKEDTDEKVAPEMRELKCDFVVYTRALAARLNEKKPPRGDQVTVLRTAPESMSLVPGLQFTVVRVSSGIPVHIDRVFLSKPYEKEEDMWLLLRAEQEKIEPPLLKRIAPAAQVAK